jgi:RNA-directed DNA polymerase
VAQAQIYVAEGYAFVVDLDLERFFDRVNHDGLMARVAARVADKRVLRLIPGVSQCRGDGRRFGPSVDEGRPARRPAFAPLKQPRA